ncbi:DMT family transporter [Celerinatantimonas sp. MCCC 1A17872]|uniref:DMT family transporter n=1 Tax=Celerinatantimonas sp. MCCC 1A17872 TaxID=3177514 RepID=UPI0038C5B668
MPHTSSAHRIIHHSLPHPYIMLLIAPVIWSSSNIIGKLSVGLLSPYQLTFYRWLVAVVVLSAMFYRQISHDWAKLMAHKWWLLTWGASAFCVFNLLLYGAYALHAKAVNVAIIHSLIPTLTIIFSFLYTRKFGHYLQWVGIGCSLFGVLWLLTSGHLSQLLNWHPSLADGLVLASAIIYALYSFALRWAPDVHWSSQMWAMSLAACFVAALAWVVHSFHDSHWRLIESAHPNSSQLLQAIVLILYVGLFIAIISKMFYQQGAIAIGGVRASVVMNLLPLFSTLMALCVFSDERAVFGSVHIVALICVVIGISLCEYGAYCHRRYHQSKSFLKAEFIEYEHLKSKK